MRQLHPVRKPIAVTVDERGCWNCGPEQQRKGGYPYVRRLGKQGPLSRWVYQLFKGFLQDDEEVRHTCDNRDCINPMHLVKGSHQQNMDDAVDRQRMRQGESHPRATLTENVVMAIVADNESTTRALAAKYHTTSGTISKIKKGKLWRTTTGITPS